MSNTIAPEINKAGPWDVPLQNYVKEFKLVVIIVNLQDESIEKEIEMNYGDFEDRKFLGRLTYWAATNGRSIETMSYADWQRTKK